MDRIVESDVLKSKVKKVVANYGPLKPTELLSKLLDGEYSYLSYTDKQRLALEIREAMFDLESDDKIILSRKRFLHLPAQKPTL